MTFLSNTHLNFKKPIKSGLFLKKHGFSQKTRVGWVFCKKPVFFSNPDHLAFLKALFLMALASGNRCAERAHFSRQATVNMGLTI